VGGCSWAGYTIRGRWKGKLRQIIRQEMNCEDGGTHMGKRHVGHRCVETVLHGQAWALDLCRMAFSKDLCNK
jgi:hypothetical protein